VGGATTAVAVAVGGTRVGVAVAVAGTRVGVAVGGGGGVGEAAAAFAVGTGVGEGAASAALGRTVTNASAAARLTARRVVTRDAKSLSLKYESETLVVRGLPASRTDFGWARQI
jgi:hypothetical protein